MDDDFLRRREQLLFILHGLKNVCESLNKKDGYSLEVQLLETVFHKAKNLALELGLTAFEKGREQLSDKNDPEIITSFALIESFIEENK